MNKIYAVEYNRNAEYPKDQGAWLIQELDEAIKCNVDLVAQGNISNDWIILGYAKGYEEADKLCSRLQDFMKNVSFLKKRKHPAKISLSVSEELRTKVKMKCLSKNTTVKDELVKFLTGFVNEK